jgi:hypothetical protein
MRDALLFARSELVLASRLSGKLPAIDGVTASIDDASLLISDVRYACDLGFGGTVYPSPAGGSCTHRVSTHPRGDHLGAQDLGKWSRSGRCRGCHSRRTGPRQGPIPDPSQRKLTERAIADRAVAMIVADSFATMTPTTCRNVWRQSIPGSPKSTPLPILPCILICAASNCTVQALRCERQIHRLPIGCKFETFVRRTKSRAARLERWAEVAWSGLQVLASTVGNFRQLV